MNQRNVEQIIRDFNSQRNPENLNYKYQKMSQDAFSFFRGTCHLFYSDLIEQISTLSSPKVWICGDLHLENFGGYKGDDRQIYFGINDFDEGTLAPCSWDLLRLVTSIFVAADSLKIDESIAIDLSISLLSNYTNYLKSGQVRAIHRHNSQGMVEDLLADLEERQRSDWLDDRTELNNNLRSLKIIEGKVKPIDNLTRQTTIAVVENWAKNRLQPDFFKVIDVANRIAGNSSLGLDRYLLLVEGNGSPDRNYLLDLKEQPTSVLQPYLSSQPTWQNEATRVTTIQNFFQIAPPALMDAIAFNGKSYVLRELQPTQDKIDLSLTEGKPNKLAKIIDTIAIVTAAAHLHGSGKKGADTAQSLMDFANNSDWHQPILTIAKNYVQQVHIDYQNWLSRT
jgi:uncharacterized protein (DUF2252 family)